jgi:O-antigen/teichoic acid export membrane protein
MSLRRQLLSQSGIIFVARMFGAGLIFLVQAAITRIWGAEALGEYLLLIAATNIVSVILPLGFETIGTYFAAEYRIKGEGRLLRGFMLRAYGHVIALMALMVIGGQYLFGLLGAPGQVILEHWWPLCLMTFGNALVLVSSALLIGIKRPFAAFFIDSLFRTMLIIGSLAIAWLAVTTGDRFGLLIWLVAGAYFIVGIAQTIYCLYFTREVPLEPQPRTGEQRRWWRFALPWVIIILATDFFFDLDLIFLSGFMAKEDLAVFGVCARIFMLVSFGVTAVYAVTLPDIFESGIKEGGGQFLKKVGDTNMVATVIALVILVGLAVGGPILLMLFGEEFLVGSVPLLVLGIGLLVRALTGPAALAISMQDRPYTTLPAVVAGVATLVVANLVLVPPMHLLGAAIAAMLSQSVWAVAMWFTALKVAKVDVSIIPRLRELLHARRGAGSAKPRDA